MESDVAQATGCQELAIEQPEACGGHEGAGGGGEDLSVVSVVAALCLCGAVVEQCRGDEGSEVDFPRTGGVFRPINFHSYSCFSVCVEGSHFSDDASDVEGGVFEVEVSPGEAKYF